VRRCAVTIAGPVGLADGLHSRMSEVSNVNTISPTRPISIRNRRSDGCPSLWRLLERSALQMLPTSVASQAATVVACRVRPLEAGISGSITSMQRAKSNFFISDLQGIVPRRPDSGTGSASLALPAFAAFVKATLTESRSRLQRCVQAGEFVWSVRSATAIEAVADAIRELPLRDAQWIADYYAAQALNRRGPEVYAEANKILEGVVDHGPLNYRAKALAAIAANTRIKGGNGAARPIYSEAARVTARCEGDLLPSFLLALQSAFIEILEGSYLGALARLQVLKPVARGIALTHPGLSLQYCNNLAVTLIAMGRLDEAEPYINLIRHSPFAKAYPEWGRTCQEFDAIRAMKPSGSVAVLELPQALDIGEDRTPDAERIHSELLSPAGMPVAPAARLDTQYTSSVDGIAVSPAGVSHNTAAPVEGDARSYQSAQRTEGEAAVQLSPRLYRHLQPNLYRARTPIRVAAVFCLRRGAVASPVLARGDCAMRTRRDLEAASNRQRRYRPGSPRSPPNQPVTA